MNAFIIFGQPVSIWAIVLAGLSGSLLLAKYWTKKHIDYLFKQKLNDVEHDYDKRLKKIESELEQNNFRYSHVFQKTETVIAETYRNLVELLDAVRIASGPRNNPDIKVSIEKYEDLEIAAQKFNNYFTLNKLYIPKPTAFRVKHLINAIDNIQINTLLNLNLENTLLVTPVEEFEAKTKKINKYDKETKELLKQIPDLLALLEDDFQTILGFPTENNKPTN